MKDILVRILLIVILLALFLAVNSGVSDLLLKQEGMDVALKRGQTLWVGLGRWMSHINWMLLIQKRASLSGKPDPSVAKALHQRYDVTTDQAPFLVLAYEHGGIELATIGQPKLGLELLEKGISIVGRKNWKLSSYAAQIVSQYLKNDPDAQAKMREYLEKARQVEGHPFYIESALVRLQSKGLENDPVAMAKLWKEVGARSVGMGEGRPLPEGVPPSALSDPLYGEYGRQYSPQACEKVVGLLRKVREEAAAEKDSARKAKLEQQAEEIVKIIKQMRGAEFACSYCFAEYQPGDKFCPNCGRAVEVYGVCPKCGRVLPETGAKFCPGCGAAVPPMPVRRTVFSSPVPPKAGN